MATKKKRRRNPTPQGGKPLTAQQLKALKALHWYIRQYGCAPTQKELSDLLKLKSVQGCKNYLYALEKKGYIRRDAGAWRGIEILIHPTEADRRRRKILENQRRVKMLDRPHTLIERPSSDGVEGTDAS